jgi:hypothetical protein
MKKSEEKKKTEKGETEERHVKIVCRMECELRKSERGIPVLALTLTSGLIKYKHLSFLTCTSYTCSCRSRGHLLASSPPWGFNDPTLQIAWYSLLSA